MTLYTSILSEIRVNGLVGDEVFMKLFGIDSVAFESGFELCADASTHIVGSEETIWVCDFAVESGHSSTIHGGAQEVCIEVVRQLSETPLFMVFSGPVIDQLIAQSIETVVVDYSRNFAL